MAVNMITVASCNLNQWAMDFDGNLDRVIASIRIAKEKGATYRLGPELELSGYGCEDHFLETDTFQHCDESLAEILAGDLTVGILCDIGMPVMHRNVRYNCRVYCLDRQIVLIRPKMCMADDGNYRETRYFTTWSRESGVEDHTLSPILAAANGMSMQAGSAVVPFGYAVIEALNTTFGCETCEELWTPDAPHIQMALGGCEIIGNGSGSHHQLRKLDTRMELIGSATRKCGGVYLYANQRGCDGGRLYFDGCSVIVKNGALLAQAPQFSVRDVEVVTATVDLDDVRSFRASVSSMQQQASDQAKAAVPRIVVPKWLGPSADAALLLSPTTPPPGGIRYHSPEEECAFGPACWLWDYLRRSGAAGYFLPLSGGADSSSTAAIVGVMCQLVCAAVRDGDEAVTADVRRVLGVPAQQPPSSSSSSSAPPPPPPPPPSSSSSASSSEPDLCDPKVLANSILHCAYMGTAHSSEETRGRARTLAQEIGAHFSALEIDRVTAAVVWVFTHFVNAEGAGGSGAEPRFLSQGGSLAEDLALQNIQARVRMVLSYLCAQLLPWVRRRRGFLLVLGSANVDEGLRGYMTKYDCSAADVNPIGSISKLDLKRLLKWAAATYGYGTLVKVEGAAPTAELRPDTDEGEAQTDEDDMGMTYEELGWYGRLRKIERCGPVQMFRKLVHAWPALPPAEVAGKVKFFFRMYAINRHKMTTLTPSYHAENYSPDDNRFDLRQFLYNVQWPRQGRRIDELVAKLEAGRASQAQQAASSLC